MLSLTLLKPELFLIVGSLASVLVSAFHTAKRSGLLLWLAFIALAVVFCASITTSGQGASLFAALYIDDLSSFARIAIISAAFFCLVIAVPNLNREVYSHTAKDFVTIVLLSVLGMLCMVSANNFMALYLGIELQSLALYILVALRRDCRLSIEAALKYLVLGAVGTGLLLYGVSLLYGVTGSIDFLKVSQVLSSKQTILSTFAMVLILTGVAFKLSLAPFHMWTPDVYQGADTPVTAFLSSASKVAALVVFVRLVLGVFPLEQISSILVVLSIASMVVGSVLGVVQSDIKRLVAYSTIGHMGYILLGLLAGGIISLKAALFYVTVYIVTNLGLFAAINALRADDQDKTSINDLAGLAKQNRFVAVSIAILLLSLAGIPPFAGFFVKFAVFSNALKAGFVIPVIIAALCSLVAAYYYLKVIKVMFFDAEVVKFEKTNPALLMIIGLSVAITVCYIVMPAFLNRLFEKIIHLSPALNLS